VKVLCGCAGELIYVSGGTYGSMVDMCVNHPTLHAENIRHPHGAHASEIVSWGNFSSSKSDEMCERILESCRPIPQHKSVCQLLGATDSLFFHLNNCQYLVLLGQRLENRAA
jgi:hypothetical protein